MKAKRIRLMPMLLCAGALMGLTWERSGSEAVSSEVPTDSGIKPLKVGDRAPDFEVEAMNGKVLRLSDHLAKVNGPVVLLFDRAHW